MKRVLYITFDFPPRRTSAVYRHVGMTKYLDRYGWQPSILTVSLRESDLTDDSLLMDSPDPIEICRTKFWAIDAWEKWALKLRERIRNRRKSAPEFSTESQPLQAKLVPARESGRKSPIRSMIRAVDSWLRSLLYFPDETAGWIPFGIYKALRLHKTKRFDLIYTSSPPKSAPVIGFFLKKLTGTPWVAEFRDPWYPSKGSLRKKAERWLLSRLLKSADAVVLISRGLADELQQKFDVPDSKVFVVSNGFDEADFLKSVSPEASFSSEHIQFSHFGTVYPGFSGKFFEALLELTESHPELKPKIKVNIVGYPDTVTQQYIRSGALKGVINLHPFLKQSQALQAMASSHVLLLFLGNAETCRLSGLGKIYWYLRVGRPILAVGHPGGSQELIEEGQAGIVVHPENKDQIKAAILSLLATSSNGHPQPKRPEFVAKLRYDTLAGELAKVLDEVSNKRT